MSLPFETLTVNRFKAGHAGASHTVFVNQLIRTFGDSKSSLASLSRIMESWLVYGRCPSNFLKIERLTEDDVRTQTNLSIPYWGEVDDSPFRRQVDLEESDHGRAAQPSASGSANCSFEASLDVSTSIPTIY
ncbi:hypothetical protein LEL_10693 [Akanthomyces lecanii RCEF 1005]|uniref:Uncharacterized protein n=1 Tax=Akanthomyces lecanii RCEF 1005 TaxID=1081108 RepID=A0A167W1R8_CORDF|nr:hypothetical protein LEL_10693 [Akanthomyces lecanii RCEF 1005]